MSCDRRNATAFSKDVPPLESVPGEQNASCPAPIELTRCETATAMSEATIQSRAELPLLLTPEQLAQVVFQIEYDEKHIAHLRRHGHLPYVQFQLKGERIFRYPRDAVIRWITVRTHSQAKCMDSKSHCVTAPPAHGRPAGVRASVR